MQQSGKDNKFKRKRVHEEGEKLLLWQKRLGETRRTLVTCRQGSLEEPACTRSTCSQGSFCSCQLRTGISKFSPWLNRKRQLISERRGPATTHRHVPQPTSSLAMQLPKVLIEAPWYFPLKKCLPRMQKPPFFTSTLPSKPSPPKRPSQRWTTFKAFRGAAPH